MEKNINRGFTDQSLFEIGPIFTGKKPGDQITVVCGIKKQLSNEESDKRINSLDVFEIKKDLIQTLVELGINKNEILIDDKTPSYYHPGISGTISSKDGKYLFAYFGQIHPKITLESYGFEIFLENLVNFKSHNKKKKQSLILSDYQKSDRDFAFLVNKDTKAQILVDAINKVDESIIKNIKIFDVYEGENIPSDKKSIAIKVTIQSDYKTLNENDLSNISNRIIKSVEEQTNAKLRS
tara:strand:+ start:33 stop:746 length:714 start_codon:yes stop_codon:yes gene_type:complete